MSDHVDIGALLMQQGAVTHAQAQLDEAYAELGRLAYRVAEAKGVTVLALIEALARDDVDESGQGDERRQEGDPGSPI